MTYNEKSDYIYVTGILSEMKC